jgi:hypothetical protein
VCIRTGLVAFAVGIIQRDGYPWAGLWRESQLICKDRQLFIREMIPAPPVCIMFWSLQCISFRLSMGIAVETPTDATGRRTAEVGVHDQSLNALYIRVSKQRLTSRHYLFASTIYLIISTCMLRPKQRGVEDEDHSDSRR